MFAPTPEQTKQVFDNLIANEPSIDSDIFTGHLGRNDTVPYIVYLLQQQADQIKTLNDHIVLMTTQLNTLTLSLTK
jgi:hypothetical protein